VQWQYRPHAAQGALPALTQLEHTASQDEVQRHEIVHLGVQLYRALGGSWMEEPPGSGC